MVLRKLLAIWNACAVLVMFLIIAIYLPTFNLDFYKAEYRKYNIPQQIGISENQLMEVTKRLTGYMLGRVDDIVITAEINGVTREFFDERDKAHMVDVKGLFDLARTAFIISLCVVIFTWAALRNDMALLFRKSRLVFVFFLALLIILAGIISLDFERAFVRFHYIFFDNDLWILDPSVSLLINIVPQEFFIDIAVRVGLIFGVLIIGYTALLAGLERKARRR